MSDDGPTAGPRSHGTTFWIGLAIGWVVMAAGIIGALDAHRDTNPPHLALWVLGAAVVHDALWASGVVILTWLTARVLPPRVRLFFRVGLAATALLALLTWPQVRGYGERAATPSALPLDYGRNARVAFIVIWAGVALAVLAAAVRDRRARSGRG